MAYTISQKLNLRPKYFAHVVVHVSTGDANIPINFEIYDGTSPYTIPSGTTITIHGHRKDGGNWMTSGTFSGSVVSFTLPQAAAAVEGAGIAEIVFAGNGMSYGSSNFLLLVEQATFPNGVSYSNDPSVFQDLLNFMNTGAIPQAVSSWLAANMTTTSPSVDKSLTVSGAAADAKATGDQINCVSKGMKEIDLAFTTGGYIDGTSGEVVSYSGWKYTDYIDVEQFTHGYFVGITSGETVRYKMFYDADHNVISGWGFNFLNTPTYVGIPINAKYMRLSCRDADILHVYDVIDNIESPYNVNKWFWYSNEAYQTKLIEVGGSKYTISVPDGYTVSIEYYNADESVLSFSAYGGTRDVWIMDFCKYVKLYIKSGSAMTAGDRVPEQVLFYPKEEYSRIEYLKLMTFNVGLWYDGVTRCPDNLVAQQKIGYRKMFGEENPDVICLQEATNNVDVSDTISYKTFTAWKYPFSYDYYYIKMRAKATMANPTRYYFASGSERWCFSFELKVGDKWVTIFTCHLSTEENSTGVRQQDLAELKTWLDQKEYGILCGDFNSYDISEVTNVFSPSNYNIANGGDFGEFATWPHGRESWPNEAIDNIICTKNISIQNVKLVDCDLSDHKPLIAELSVYY